MGLYSNLIHYFTLQSRNLEEAVRFAREGLPISNVIRSQGDLGPALLLLRNNAAFALIEAGFTDEAGAVLSQISPWVHKEPHPTATLGFFNLTKGHVSRGLELYREAIRMLPNGTAREEFTQKLNLELGKCYSRLNNAEKARVYLSRAINKSGLAVIEAEAKRLLRALPFKP